ncbi:MAG: ImmA/IrrE family metallo-endopeptidase [Nitrososphaerales archaeon]
MAIVKALVKKELLSWARKSAGFSIAVAAKKVPVQEAILEAWETTNDKKPTIAQLRKLSEIYKRPLAIFYLSEPPMDFQPMRDLRRRGNERETSPELHLEIRQAHERREAAIELFSMIGEEIPALPQSQRASLSEEAEEVGARIRKILGIQFSEQITWTDKYKPFNNWRAALEEKGVLVSQITEVDSDEVAGFSLSYPKLPVICVNIKDGPRARTFTLLHEFVHLLLHQHSLCNLLAWDKGRPQDAEKIETFCNRVAGAALIPKRFLLYEELVLRHDTSPEWEDSAIETLAYKRYGTSREVLLRRLLIFGKTTKEFYEYKRQQYRTEYLDSLRDRKPGFVPPPRMAVAREGKPFIGLVLRNYYEKKITLSNLSGLLQVRLKHLPRIEAEVMGRVISRVKVS